MCSSWRNYSAPSRCESSGRQGMNLSPWKRHEGGCVLSKRRLEGASIWKLTLLMVLTKGLPDFWRLLGSSRKLLDESRLPWK